MVETQVKLDLTPESEFIAKLKEFVRSVVSSGGSDFDEMQDDIRELQDVVENDVVTKDDFDVDDVVTEDKAREIADEAIDDALNAYGSIADAIQDAVREVGVDDIDGLGTFINEVVEEVLEESKRTNDQDEVAELTSRVEELEAKLDTVIERLDNASLDI